jgi:LysM repeat protein
MPCIPCNHVRWRFGAILLSLALLLVLVTSAYAQDGQTVHIVQPGETLYRIGLQYGVSVDQLVAANGLIDPSLIYPGQKLIIPVAALPRSPTVSVSTIPSSSPIHIVQSGETLVSIGWRYGVSRQEIASANHLGNTNLIYVGQQLVIPGATSSSPPATTPLHNAQLNVPVYGQLHSLSCEAAASRMMASYYAVIQDEGWFQTAFGLSDNPHMGFRGNVDGVFGWINDYGTYAEPVARVLQSSGITATARYSMTYEDLRMALNQGSPVIVWTSSRTDSYIMPEGYRLVPEEHTFIVVGYDDTGFTVHDPLYGGRILQLPAIPGWELFGNMAVVGQAQRHQP